MVKIIKLFFFKKRSMIEERIQKPHTHKFLLVTFDICFWGVGTFYHSLVSLKKEKYDPTEGSNSVLRPPGAAAVNSWKNTSNSLGTCCVTSMASMTPGSLAPIRSEVIRFEMDLLRLNFCPDQLDTGHRRCVLKIMVLGLFVPTPSV